MEPGESNLCSPLLHITSGIIKEKPIILDFGNQTPSGIRMVICIHTRLVSTFQKPAPNLNLGSSLIIFYGNSNISPCKKYNLQKNLPKKPKSFMIL